MPTEHPQKSDPGAGDPLSPRIVADASIGIVVSDWNQHITRQLLEGALARLEECGVESENIYVSHVPGAVELAFGARQMAMIEEPKAVIMLGCIIDDGTPKFASICNVVTHAVAQLNLRNDIPFIDGVMMSKDEAQLQTIAPDGLPALGAVAAESALKMVNMMANIVMR